MSEDLDLTLCDALVARVTTGDLQARQELVAYLWPHWIGWIKSNRSMGPLARSEDHIHNVATKLVAKMSERSSDHLDQYLQWRSRQPDKTFEDWTRIVITNQVRDYAREVLGGKTGNDDEPSAKRLLNEYVAFDPTIETGTRPPFTAVETARELMEFARTRLPSEQLSALGSWLEGASYEDIEQMLGFSAGNGKRLVRAAVAVLRRFFSEGELGANHRA